MERGLSFDRLRSLVEVGQAGSIAKAVHGDGVRQSQYSRQMKELEEFFGVELTRKRGKVLVLTTAGRELARMATETFSAFENFRTESRNIPRRFTLGAGDSLHYWIVTPIWEAAVKEQKPWLFAMENLRNNEVATKLLDMSLDIGVLRRSAIVSDVLKWKPLIRLGYAFYIPRELVKKGKGTDLEWLIDNVPLATLAYDSSFYVMLENCCAGAKIKLEVAFKTASFPFAQHLLKTRQCMAVLPEICERNLDKSFIKIQPPAFKKLERDIVLAWNPRLAAVRPAARAVIDFFAEKIKVI